MSRCVSLYQALANASLNLPQHHRKGPPQGDSINSLGRGCYPCARHADCGWHAHVRTRRLWAEGGKRALRARAARGAGRGLSRTGPGSRGSALRWRGRRGRRAGPGEAARQIETDGGDKV